ncbi:MAG TPA: ankyrin repeat domain-containing protein [Verrucomicrobiae bacterium]|nr:ankyrin repeat domain-containing protein [Verrucomicrobiae bacterium]
MKTILVSMLMLIAPATLFSAEAVNARLQQALYEEEANQNLDAAIAAYQSILKAHQEERKLAATAQFRLGQCYRKLGRTNDAVQQYRQLLRDFSEQTNLVRLSEQSLAALGNVNGPGGTFAERLNTIVQRGSPIVQSASPDPETVEINRLESLIRESPDLINARADTPPLHQAVRGHQARVATFLLDRGADVNLRDNAGNTALCLAAQLGDRQMAELLIERNANVNLENQKNTPLLIAANNGFKSIVELLLAKGADISATDARERTALHIAAADNRKEIAEVLLARKADLNARSSEGSPLFLAVQRGLVNMASLLISRGADVDAKAPPNGRTALVQAIANLNQGLVELLLDHKADPNARYEMTFDAVPDQPNPNNYKPTINAAQLTPIMLAGYAGNTSIVALLIKAGADVNAQDSTGATALLWAVRRDKPGAVDVLLNGGAEVNRADRYGLTPLRMATSLGREALVRTLLQHGAAPNLAAASEPPLHGAVRYRHKAVIEMLLDSGADIGATDRYGQTALDLAKLNRTPNQERGNNAPTIDGPELVTLLRQRGASEYVPRAGLITVCRISRDFSQPYLFKGTNDYNRHTLLELIVAVYGDPTARNSPLAFPDVANLRISRRDPGMKQLREIKVDLNSLLPTNDVPLEWGDVVEIPELDHRANESWDGFAGPDIEAINRILTRKIEIRVKGENYPVTLVPSWNASTRPSTMVMGGLGSPLSGAVPVQITPPLAPGQPGPLGGVPVGVLGQPGPLGGVPGGVPGVQVIPPSRIVPPGQPGRPGAPVSAPKTLSGFRLRSVMLQANVLRVSSDLSRVKVKRTDPKTKQVQELVFDLATAPANNDPSDLWLQDGDIIDVPERGA